MSLTVIYRLSDNGYAKEKFAFATKQFCLENFCKSFPRNRIYLMVDNTNLKEETYRWIREMHNQEEFAKVFLYTGGSSARSWRIAFELATNQLDDHTKDIDSPNITARYNLVLPDDEYVLFQEDDYLYRKGSMKVLLEGLKRADYVSLYDHLDTYVPASKGGNMLVCDEGYSKFPTYIIRTASSHWRTVSSTTMTFASQIKTLKEDEHIWRKYTQGTYPQDCAAFMELTMKRGRSLITPIPSYSTHTEPAWAAPGIDWEKE